MKIQRTPLLLLAIAALLGGIVYLQETQFAPKQADSNVATKEEKLFTFKEEDVQSITVKLTDNTLSFEKNPEKPSPSPSPSLSPSVSPSGSPSPSPTASPEKPPRWSMTAPQKIAANDGSIAYLLNLLATGKTQKTIKTQVSQLSEFGLDKPLATIDVILADKKPHRVVLGRPNFNRSGLYAQIDPPATPIGEIPVQLVSMDFESAVTRPIAEWQHQPKKAETPAKKDGESTETPTPTEETPEPAEGTPTPSPSPTDTPKPTPSKSPTPTTSPTSTPNQSPSASPSASPSPSPSPKSSP